jgi:hypothetical protein
MSAIGESDQLPASLEREAARLAQEDGVSLSHWVSLAVAQKIGAVETAAEFFRRRSQGSGAIEDAIAILDSGPDNPPLPGDELPEGYTPT